MKVLVDYFIPYVNLDSYDADHTNNSQQTLYLNSLVAIIESVRKDIQICPFCTFIL